MGRSLAVRSQEVLAAATLARETREVAASGGEWHRHLADGLLKVFPSQVSCVPEVEILDGGVMVLHKSVQGGHIDDADRQKFLSYMSDPDPDAADPTIAKLIQANDRVVCVRREDMVRDEKWYASKHFNEFRRPAGLNHVMFGFVPTGKNRWRVGIGLHRAHNDRPFSATAPIIFHIVCEGISELCRKVGPPVSRLDAVPPRRRQVLERLLMGDSERLAASALAMTQHAVHAHVKALYRQFGVGSRGELLARFIERPPAGSGQSKTPPPPAKA